MYQSPDRKGENYETLSMFIAFSDTCMPMFFGCTTEGGTQTDDPVTTVKSPTISEPASTEDEARTFFR